MEREVDLQRSFNSMSIETRFAVSIGGIVVASLAVWFSWSFIAFSFSVIWFALKLGLFAGTVFSIWQGLKWAGNKLFGDGY